MRKRGKKMVKYIILSWMVLLAATGLSGCSIFSKEKEIKPDLVVEMNGKNKKTNEDNFTTVKRGDLTIRNSLNCTAKCRNEKKYYFGISGLEYEGFRVSVGDKVKKGDVIGTLDMTGVEEAIEESKSAYELKQLEYKNYDVQIADAREVAKYSEENNDDQIRSLQSQKEACSRELSLLKLKYDEAVNEFRQRRIVADMDGTISYLFDYKKANKSAAEQGQPVPVLSNKELGVVRIAEDEYYFACDTEEYKNYPVGTVVDMKIDNQTYKMKVSANSKSENSSNSHHLEFSFLEDAFEITEDSRGVASLPATELFSVLYVEENAVVNLKGKDYVYLVDGKGMRTAKEVTLGLSDGTYVVIESGVKEGDKVMLKGEMDK